MKPLPPHLTGGHFLLAETDPSLVFTPEDLSTEERQITESAEKFMDKEVLPNLEPLEHQEPGLAVKLFKEVGNLGLHALEVPEEYGGLGLGKKAATGVAMQLSRLGGFGVWRIFWALFGASNQLLAALTLLGITVWLWRTRRQIWVLFVVGLPTVFMYTMSTWALVRMIFGYINQIPKSTSPQVLYVLLGISSLLLVLAVAMLFEAVIALSKRNDQPNPPNAKAPALATA